MVYIVNRVEIFRYDIPVTGIRFAEASQRFTFQRVYAPPKLRIVDNPFIEICPVRYSLSYLITKANKKESVFRHSL